jgi:mono/diheme cytochrome c family protein
VASLIEYRIRWVERPKMPIPRLKIILPLAAAAAAAIAIPGCLGAQTVDTEAGMQLFTTKCGTCHTLKGAGTAATVGPNLDDAFRQARADGMDSDTVEGIVRQQIEIPRVTSPQDTKTYMPANLVTGQDAEDVAAYVASVAGVPGVKPPITGGGPGGQVFLSQGCGSCHTLKAANATGTVGPDLDEVLKGQDAAMILKSIVDPEADITQGFSAGIMPTTFAALPKDQLNDLVDFLIQSVKNDAGS